MLLVRATTAIINYFDSQSKETTCFDVDDDHGMTVSHCFPTEYLDLILTFFGYLIWVIYEQACILPSLMSRKKSGILRPPKCWLSGGSSSHYAKSRERTKTVSFPVAKQGKPIYYRLSTDEKMAKMASWHWVKTKPVLSGFIPDRVVEQVQLLAMGHPDLGTIELSKGKKIKYGYCQQQAAVYFERKTAYQREAGTNRTFVVAAEEDSVLSIEQREPSSGFLEGDQANDEGIQLEESPLSTSHDDEGGHNDGCTGTDDDDATKSNVVSGPPLLRRSARIAKLAKVDYSSGGGIQKLWMSARLAALPRVDYRCFL
jgi:hypothetical protein